MGAWHGDDRRVELVRRRPVEGGHTPVHRHLYRGDEAVFLPTTPDFHRAQKHYTAAMAAMPMLHLPKFNIANSLLMEVLHPTTSFAKRKKRVLERIRRFVRRQRRRRDVADASRRH